MWGKDSGIYLQREKTSQKRTFLHEEGVWVPYSPMLCSRGCHLNIFRAANHLTIPSQLTTVTLCILFLSALVSTEWGNIRVDICFSQREEGTRGSSNVDPSQGKLLAWREWFFTEFGLNGKGWVRCEEGKRLSLTCPLQSQGSLKATYSSSLLYMPRLVLVGFLQASNWNCILAILSKSLERWRWTWERKPWRRT